MVDLPKRIDRFLRIASRYWQHYQLERIEEGILATAAREKSQARNARFFADLMKHQRNRNSARKALVKIGRVLAVKLEKRGEDSTALLYLLNVVDGGGGPLVAGSLWGPVKAALQRLAIIADLPPVTPASNGKTRAKRRGGGRKKDPAVQARNKKVAADFRNGLDVDAVVERYRISAPLARKLKSESEKTAKNRQS